VTDEIEADFQGALEEINVPSFVLDRDAVIRWANPAAIREFGDNRGKTIWSLLAPGQAERARELFARTLFGGEGPTEEHAVVIGPDGKHIEVEFSSGPIREDGHVIGVFGLVTHSMFTEPPAPHPLLTPRQMQVLRLLADGRSTQQIAKELHLAIETIRNHVRHLLRALDAHSRLEAIATARREGLLRG
jgi:PAS domain S-box-containing protein